MSDTVKRLSFGAAVFATLAVAFLGYLQPSFIVDLANRIILCL